MKRKEKHNRKRFLSEDQRKEALDRSTSYTTLLPAMNEGFHMGYRPVPGLQSDGSRQPHQWLASMARNMNTPGGEVGFAIPDVLACEQQLRRVSSLPGDLSLRYQEMIDFRALLALLLLWDELEATPGCPRLTMERLSEENGGFAAMVLAAMSPTRAREGLLLAVLTREDGDSLLRMPLCLIGKDTLLTPAAHPEDMSRMLPAAVRWYDREQKRFSDPCPWLDEKQLAVVLPRLRLLMALCEGAAPGSPLYDPAARLCAPLGRFAEDLLASRQPWRDRLADGDQAAAVELRTRVQAVYGLLERGGDNCPIRRLELLPQAPGKNPLLALFLPEDHRQGTLQPQIIYTLDGIPFARESGLCLLEPTGAEGESGAMARLAEECAMLDRYDSDWRMQMAARLGQLHERLNGRTGLLPCVPSLLTAWQQSYAEKNLTVRQEAQLTYPRDADRMAVRALLRDKLGIRDGEAAAQPFADCLVLIRGAAEDPFGGRYAPCTLPAQKGNAPLYVLPPVSAALCRALMEEDAPQLPPEQICAQWSEDGAQVYVTLRLEKGHADGSLTAIDLCRSYALADTPRQGAAFIVDAESLPMVSVWPNVRFKGDVWTRYYVHTHAPGSWQALAVCGSEWIPGVNRTAPDGEHGLRRWQTLAADRFPAYVVLRMGQLSAGALINDLPARRVRRETAAAVGLDFGSISTTVMLRQGDRIMPASLPEGLAATLLRPTPAPLEALGEELIPPTALLHGSANEARFYSVMDLFSDEPETWQQPLLDGHIYYPASLASLEEKNEGTLYYDLKWSEEPYVMACLRLLLKQVLLQASLSARLHGSPSVSWRVSVPNAMSAPRQESYLNLLRGLAREVAQECGMPLTEGEPAVLYATENQAAGMYFRGRNEVSAQGGYLNLDIGGGTADISLWLRNAGAAAVESSLMHGCRQMLFASVAQGHIDDFRKDYQDAPPALREAAAILCDSLKQGTGSGRRQQKCMLLMDDFFAAYPEEIRQTLQMHRDRGGLAYTEALLLFGLGFLFYLCGIMLRRAGEDEKLAALMPSRIELCIAGNGGQFLHTIDGEARTKLCQMALTALPAGHPLRVLQPVQSREPKLEVASGLLCDDGMLLSSLRSVVRWNGTFPDRPIDQRPNLIKDWLPVFITMFPQAADRLLGGMYHTHNPDGSPALTPGAEMELTTIFENEIASHPDDDLTAAVRCMATVRRLWRI